MRIVHEAGQDALHDYSKLKFDLAAILRSLLHTAERLKDDLSVSECRHLLARLAEDRFNLAIVGQFSRGKSSLMNALLGSEKLPTGILPLTSVITSVTYGETERVLLRRKGWAFPQEIRLDQLAEYVTQGLNPGNEKRVVLAEVQLPNELLRLGVRFVDTPGVASAILANTRATRQFLPEADAAIFVTSFDSPMTEAEVAFMREVQEHVRKVFIVVNKLDLASGPDSVLVLNSVRETAREIFPEAQPEIFALSARQALLAKQSASTEGLAQSGLPALETALSEFLRDGKAHEFLLHVATRTARIGHQQELAIRISRDGGGTEGKAVIEKRLIEITSSLGMDREAMIAAVSMRVPSQFRERCGEAAPLWTTETESLLGSQIEAWFSRAQGELTGRTLEEFLLGAFQGMFSGWLSRYRDQIDQIFQAQALEENGLIEKLAGKIAELPADVLGATCDDISPPSIDLPKLAFRELQITFNDIKVRWWYELVPTGRWRDHIARQWRRRAAEFGRIYQQSASEVLETSIRDWVEDVNREMRTRVERMSGQVRALMSQSAQSPELAGLEHLLDRLQVFRKTVLGMGVNSTYSQTSLALPDAGGAQHQLAIQPCRICVRIENTLRDFLAHRQYELSVNESDQHRHAMESGFCPLHTWQYEALASPQGVCAAYAELLGLFAKCLRQLVENATSIQSMEDGVRTMLPTSDSCEACRLVASTEEAGALEIVHQLAENDRSGGDVCAFHLCSVLKAGPDLNVATSLLLREAQIFERLSENMQNHILNHEAIRHHLSSNAERDSATTGLARIAGLRNVVMSLRVE